MDSNQGQGAISGGLSGAMAGGQIAGPYGAIAGGIGGALLGGRLAGKKPQAPNFQPLINQVNAGKTEQNQITGALPGQINPLYGQYQGNLAQSVANAKNSLGGAGQSYLSGLNQNLLDQSNGQAALLKQQAADVLPGQQQQLAQQIAASGQAGNGAGIRAQQALAINNANQLSEGQQALAQNLLQQKAQAQGQIFGQNAAQTHQVLGLNEDEYNTLLSSGRQDLINEANQLVQESQNATGQLLGVGQLQQGQNQAYNLGNQAGNANFLNSILQAVGSYAGQRAGSRQPLTAPSQASRG